MTDKIDIDKLTAMTAEMGGTTTTLEDGSVRFNLRNWGSMLVRPDGTVEKHDLMTKAFNNIRETLDYRWDSYNNTSPYPGFIKPTNEGLYKTGDDELSYAHETFRRERNGERESRTIRNVNYDGVDGELKIYCPDPLESGSHNHAKSLDQLLRDWNNYRNQSAVVIDSENNKHEIPMDTAIRLEKEALVEMLGEKNIIHRPNLPETSDASCGLAPNLVASMQDVGVGKGRKL